MDIRFSCKGSQELCPDGNSTGHPVVAKIVRFRSLLVTDVGAPDVQIEGKTIDKSNATYGNPFRTVQKRPGLFHSINIISRGEARVNPMFSG